MQQARSRQADARCRRRRPDAGQEQGLGGVDVADAHHHIARQQHLLDRRLPPAQGRVKGLGVEIIAQRLHAQAPQQLDRLGRVFTARMHHRAKAPRVVQTQHAPRRDQVKVIMSAAIGQLRREGHAARHAQVQEQQPLVQIEQQVLAAAPHALHGASGQLLRRAAQGPAQGLAQVGRDNARAGNAVGKTQARDFDFWQLGHGISSRIMMARMKPLARVGSLLAALLGATALAHAQAPAPAAIDAGAAPIVPSPLTAELFYQLLLGEMAARGEDPGSGFSLVLDAARKTSDPALFRRAIEIALQARAGESALQAARAWHQTQPASREANRFVLQILLALNRVAESAEPLRTDLALAPTAGERNMALALVPRLYSRASDKRLAVAVVERALADSLARPEHASAGWIAIGRVRLAAGDLAGTLEAARRAQAQDAGADGPALLALEVLPRERDQAEAIIARYLQQRPRPEVRLAYVRALLDEQRLDEASTQLAEITRQKPELEEAWFLSGLLLAQQGKDAEAQSALQRFIVLAGAPQRGDPTERNRALARAYFTLSQLAQRRGDLTEAGRWLEQISDPQDLLEAVSRRADLLARQGRIDQARQLLRDLPARSPEQARSRLLAEAQLLREFKQYQAAYDLLGGAIAQAPQDPELLYEQAMVAEKLGRHAELEHLLRQAIAIKPDFHHAYNALGYSLAERNERLSEARELIVKALEYAPGDPFITDSLAWVEFRLGNKAEALRLLEQAFRRRPDAEIAAHLGEVLWASGQRERAQAIWREGMLLNQNNETLLETLRRFQVKP